MSRRTPPAAPVAEKSVPTPGSPDHPDLRNRFREVMARVPTPVSVISSMAAGLPYGTTVSAFASLSMAPPMVLVSLDRNSELLAVVREVGRFGVNVLGAHQADLASTFAKKGGPAKFSDAPWETDHELPRLPGAPGWLACEVAALVDGGDHVVALGTVVAADTIEGQPLTYHNRVFGTHAVLPEA
ncbi:flavin reductase family protein [Streptomyces sp. NPDC007162]|uniref:flavin reductase family protein n=1 Tax=Streptomyces sp. NPDC007162 TaxID=3156917 RepID=UPI003405627C